MSLWIALIWLVCAVVCAGIFLFCRKRLADVAQQVSEEFENQVSKILEADRNAEARLLETFSSFGNSAEAIQIYQKAEAEIFRSPQAKPSWNWSCEDLEFWRKRAEGKARAGRSRPVILGVVVVVLALSTAAAITSVVTLNSVRPIMVAQASPVGTAIAFGEQLPPPVSLPPLPTEWSQTLPDDNVEPVNLSPHNVSSDISDCNMVEPCDFKSKGAGNE